MLDPETKFLLFRFSAHVAQSFSDLQKLEEEGLIERTDSYNGWKLTSLGDAAIHHETLG